MSKVIAINWLEIGYGLEAKIIPNNSVLIRNKQISNIPQLRLELDNQNNIIDFSSCNGLSAGGVEARYLIINLVKEKMLKRL